MLDNEIVCQLWKSVPIQQSEGFVVVEHDMHVIAQSDWIIDIGPGAGNEGGHIVAQGTPREVSKVGESKTALYLRKTFNGEL